MADDPWPEGEWPGDLELAREVRAWAASWRGRRDALSAILGSTALTDPASVAVVTGQQPAVGGGPLYTLVKAAQACALARRLRAAGVIATPVFWCASEDHDLGEADHADLLRSDGRLRRVRADLGPGRASLRFRPASLWWEALVAASRVELRGRLGAAWLLSRQPLREEAMGAWLCRLLGELFADQGLVCVEAHRLRPLWRDALDGLSASWPAAALAGLRSRLLAAGQGDAFAELSTPPLFLDLSDGRTPVEPAQLPGLLATRADAISPGAALRPILQQLALPAALAVTGPGEWAYHRFLAPAYAALGACRPRLVPRCSLTLVPSWCERGVERWGVGLDRLLEGSSPPPFPSSSQEACAPQALAGLAAALAALELAARREEEDASVRLRTGHARLMRERDRLLASLERGRRRSAALPAWGALTAWARPRAEPQDRVMSLFQALWEHGPGLAGRLVDAIDAGQPGSSAFVRLQG